MYDKVSGGQMSSNTFRNFAEIDTIDNVQLRISAKLHVFPRYPEGQVFIRQCQFFYII